MPELRTRHAGRAAPRPSGALPAVAGPGERGTDLVGDRHEMMGEAREGRVDLPTLVLCGGSVLTFRA